MLGIEPDAAMRGADRASRACTISPRAYPDALPADIEAELMRIADAHFAKLDGSPLVKAFWRPQLAAFRPLVRGDRAGAADGHRAHPDRGRRRAPSSAADFTLTARADRIDVGDDGAVVIYDYKTGKLPAQKHVEELYAPQLPLEAAIAEGGGFEGLGERERQRARLYPRLGPR